MSANGAAITGLGAYQPRRVVTNDDLAGQLDTDDAWIRRRTGIAARRVAGDHESVAEMAAAAGRKAVAAAGVDPAEIGLVVLATCSAPGPLPGLAAEVAGKVGAERAGGFDLNAACAGFSYALGMAADAVRAGTSRHVLVLGAERMSDLIDWTDRSSAILFGDGAGAAVVSASADDLIGPTSWGCDGRLAELIGTTADGKIRLDGPAVFRWAVGALGGITRDICQRNGLEVNDLAAFVPHQANARIIDAVVRDLGIEPGRVARDVVDHANTSAASIPLALTTLVEAGRIGSGDRALLLGFGAGLTWAGQIITLP